MTAAAPLQNLTTAAAQAGPAPRRAAEKSSSARGFAKDFLFTLATTVLLFFLFFVQGILVARVLGPSARGEFGTLLFFPRDLLLYVGLFGGIELMTSMAARRVLGRRELRRAACRLALATAALTAVGALTCSALFLWAVDRLYLLPLTAFICLFLPLEHLQMIVSGVDRGAGLFARYNRNRLVFAAVFPVLILIVFGLGWQKVFPIGNLEWVCGLFVLSRLVGLIPTMLAPSGESMTSIGTPIESDSAAASEFTLPKMLKNGGGYALSMLATETFERLDVLLILMLAGLDQTGNYLVAIPAATLATLVPNTLALFAFNFGANPGQQLNFGQRLGIVSGILVVQALTAALLALILPALIAWFFGARFDQASSFALWLLPACALKGYLQFADGYLKGRGRSRIGIITRVCAIIVLLASVWLAYPHLGLWAVPLAAAISQAFCTCVLTVFLLQPQDQVRTGTLAEAPQ